MSQHWYDRQGNSCHEITGKNGRLRSTTLRDAKANGWLPSVSGIIGIMEKSALTTWLINQALDAALTLPRAPDESLEEFKARALDDSKQQARLAMDEGSRVHDALEAYYTGGYVPQEYRQLVAGVSLDIATAFPHVKAWSAEESFAHPDGYAGRCDLRSKCGTVLLDFKTKSDLTPGTTKKLAYGNHAQQLAAYARGFGMAPGQRANVFVATKPQFHGYCQIHHWTPDEMADAENVFLACLALWKAVHKYDAAFERKAVAA